MQGDTKLFAIFCVVATAFVMFIYNLTHMSPWKPPDTESRIQFRNKQRGNNNKMHPTEMSGTEHPQKIAPRTNLIILSPGRGGSSFLGAIFDSSQQNTENMYWFEPLHVLTKKQPKVNLLTKGKKLKEYKQNYVTLIERLLKCDFSNLTNAFLSKFAQNFFYVRSKAFTTLCPNGRCRPFSSTLLSKACNSYKHTVIKILNDRLPNNTIQSFQELFRRQNGYDVKVIQLVRDPRAVVYSRVYLAKWVKGNYRDPNFRLYVQEICDHVKQNIRIGLEYPLPWLKDRFKLIRFEDIVVNTANISRELYRFAGFDWSVSVDKFISAHSSSSGNPKVGPYAYSLFRNSSNVIDQWKNASKDFIRVVEDVCGDLMHILGYEKLLKPD